MRHVFGSTVAAPNDTQTRATRLAYLGAVSYVDDQIGSLLATLRQAMLDARTVILGLPDPADMRGERGLWYKVNFFESACRIPLIVHAPERFVPHRVSESASLLDIFPTLVDLASEGAATAYSAPIDGRSLLPALEGRAVPGEVVGEYLAEGAIAPIVMIRRGHYKFVHSAADPDQLYDLRADPDERINLSSRADCTALVAEFRTEVPRPSSLPAIHQSAISSPHHPQSLHPPLR